ncbi:MAG: restriction endonuclease [Candidatus Dependentiae bacterium]
MTHFIKKVSGQKEAFNEQKIIRSLQQIGADDNTIYLVMDKIKQQYPNIKNTQQIFAIALGKLKEIHIGMASRYNLKKALLGLGPAGYSFEQFIGTIFQAQGYKVTTNITAQGFCVTHELDVVASKGENHFMIECKFHNKQRYKSSIKIPLYVKARFEDIKKALDKGFYDDTHTIHKAWVATNTNFSADAISYAQCVGMHLLSWNFPIHKSIKDLIAQYKLYPITTLVNLTNKQKKLFLKHGLVLCRDVEQNKNLLKSLGYSSDEINKLIKEAQQTCTLDAA